MIEAVIQKLRALQGLGVITRAHCVRAECYVKRHPEHFAIVNASITEVAYLALDCVALPDEFASLAVAVAAHEAR